MHAGELFPGFRVDAVIASRDTGFDLSLDEAMRRSAQTFQRELRRAAQSGGRLELAHDTPAEVEGFCARLCTCSRKTFTRRGPLHLPICLLWCA